MASNTSDRPMSFEFEGGSMRTTVRIEGVNEMQIDSLTLHISTIILTEMMDRIEELARRKSCVCGSDPVTCKARVIASFSGLADLALTLTSFITFTAEHLTEAELVGIIQDAHSALNVSAVWESMKPKDEPAFNIEDVLEKVFRDIGQDASRTPFVGF